MSTVREAEPMFRQQLDHCRSLSERYPRDELVSKALGSARKSLSQLTSFDSSVLVVTSPAREALQAYTQSILDSSYHRECRLVEGDFPDDISRTEILAIIESLGLPVALCGAAENIKAALGIDQFECINWRVGALMYMYVHELMASEKRKETAGHVFIRECCVVGVCHLGLMLSARAPLDPCEDCTSQDPTTSQLLQEGIFSDIHMLALMYAGEMCYWAWELETAKCSSSNSRAAADSPNRVESQTPQTGAQPAPPTFSGLLSQMRGREYVEHYCTHFSPVDTGQRLLERYIKLAQGPLKAQNWSYARAVQLVVQLKRNSK